MSHISSKFQLLAAPAKRELASPAPVVTRAKVPRAGEISLTEIPRPQAQQSRRLPLNANVEICIYKITDEAADLWDMFAGKPEVTLFQVQIAHEQQRPITYQMKENFNDFLASSAQKDSTMPTNLQELETAAGVKLIVADRLDPESIGFQQWRVAFYCTDACNLLRLLDSWLEWKHKQMARETPLQVNIHPHIGVDLDDDISDELLYENYKFFAPEEKLPLHVFEAQPVVGKRITIFNIQLKDEKLFDLIITGHSWPFKAQLDNFGIQGGYKEDASSEKKLYFRVWKSVDVTGDDATRFKDMLSSVFHNCVLRVNVDSQPKPDSPVEKFIDQLREIPQLFFTTQPTEKVATSAE